MAGGQCLLCSGRDAYDLQSHRTARLLDREPLGALFEGGLGEAMQSGSLRVLPSSGRFNEAHGHLLADRGQYST